MRDSVTDLNTAVASGEDDFVHECDCEHNDYDLAKGPVCHKHASGRNRFTPLEELSQEQIHPDYFLFHGDTNNEPGIEGEEDDGYISGNWTDGGEDTFNDRYMQMYDRIVNNTVETVIMYADTVTQYAELVLNSSKPFTSFVCESYFSFLKDENDERDDFGTAAPFEGWGGTQKCDVHKWMHKKWRVITDPLFHC
jgi:hypothetical protein